MKIGVPSEIKPDEYRVGLTPGGVREYAAAGHTVLVQSGAGAGIGADRGLLVGLNVIAGRMVNRAVGESLDLPWSDPLTALAA